MDHRDNIKKELEELGSALAGMKKKNPYSTPDRYFDQFTDSVMEKVTADQENKVAREDKRKGFSLSEFFQSIFSPRIAIAGASFLVFLIAGSIWLMKMDNSSTFNLEVLSDLELQTYVLALSEGFDNEEVSDYVNTTDALFMDAGESDMELLRDYLDEELDDSFIEDEWM